MKNKNCNPKKVKTRLLAGDAKIALARQRLFKGVFTRLREAVEAGFNVEAVALEESFITDRVSSFLCHATGDDVYRSYGPGVREIQKDSQFMGELLRFLSSSKKCKLSEEWLKPKIFDKWWLMRNRALHDLAFLKDNELKTPNPFELKYKEVRVAAEIGYKICRGLDNTCLKLRRNANRVVKAQDKTQIEEA